MGCRTADIGDDCMSRRPLLGCRRESGRSIKGVMATPITFWLTAPWFVGLSYWRQARFKEGREYEVVVPPGPDGRPGERLTTPSPSLHRPRVVQGSRSDFGGMIDRHGSTITGVCLGRVADRGNPSTSARDTLAHFWEKGWIALTPMSVEEIGGEEAFRYQIALPSGARLTEWKFAHAGWLYAVGSRNRAHDEDITLSRARSILDTWEWLPS
jgi:hypothetical protein